MQWRSFSLLLLGAAAFAATLLIGTLLCPGARLRSAQVTALNYACTLEVRLDATFRRADSLHRRRAAGAAEGCRRGTSHTTGRA